MDFEKAGEIINKYGNILEKVGKEITKKYPAVVFPESLLPYSKEIIYQASEIFSRYSINKNAGKAIKEGLAWLDLFINDEEANKRNNELLNNPKYMEKLLNKEL